MPQPVKPVVSFDFWMRLVDRELEGLCGLVSADLPDWLYRDAYDDGVTPQVAAKRALKAAQSDE